jgi:hypothetical protein
MATAFQLPVWFDLAATFAFALTGALAAIKRGYDIVGLLSLAIVSGIGGGLIRDGVFLQQGVTPLLTNPHYLYVIGAAAVVGLVLGERVHHFNRVIALVDALGLGAYACFGVQKSLQVGLGKKSLLGGDVEDGHGGGATAADLERLVDEAGGQGVEDELIDARDEAGVGGACDDGAVAVDRHGGDAGVDGVGAEAGGDDGEREEGKQGTFEHDFGS